MAREQLPNKVIDATFVREHNNSNKDFFHNVLHTKGNVWTFLGVVPGGGEPQIGAERVWEKMNVNFLL